MKHMLADNFQFVRCKTDLDCEEDYATFHAPANDFFQSLWVNR